MIIHIGNLQLNANYKVNLQEIVVLPFMIAFSCAI